MALREIRTYPDEILNKISKPVTEMKPRFSELIDDMLETMYSSGGVGLAAVQVGVLRRIVVIDVSPEADSPMVLINPEIIEMDGTQTGDEGCLSVPGKHGIVTRAMTCKVKCLNRDMEEVILEGEGLLARCFQHEIDHLDGKMYVDKVEGELENVYQEDFDEEDLED
ncbi:MAG: peptide deformylase [Lachnospiraceae bacterium]|nr:peptide deformylase [Lachnospiraceae bacterium]